MSSNLPDDETSDADSQALYYLKGRKDQTSEESSGDDYDEENNTDEYDS